MRRQIKLGENRAREEIWQIRDFILLDPSPPNDLLPPRKLLKLCGRKKGKEEKNNLD